MSQTALPITEYICRYTGARMTVCCCEPTTAQGAPVLERACCCDVRMSEGVLDPRAVDAAMLGVESPQAIVALQVTRSLVMRSSTSLDVLMPMADRPPDRGRPVYLVQRRLLI